jgi:hypothetical protein
MLRCSLAAVTMIAAVFSAAPAVAEAGLTRIEPRPYYGAVVTVEQGVRVWRPLPPTRHMIINPTNAPVSVNITDVRETVNHHGMPLTQAPVVVPGADASSGNRYLLPYAQGRKWRHHGNRPHRAARIGGHRAAGLRSGARR